MFADRRALASSVEADARRLFLDVVRPGMAYNRIESIAFTGVRRGRSHQDAPPDREIVLLSQDIEGILDGWEYEPDGLAGPHHHG